MDFIGDLNKRTKELKENSLLYQAKKIISKCSNVSNQALFDIYIQMNENEKNNEQVFYVWCSSFNYNLFFS